MCSLEVHLLCCTLPQEEEQGVFSFPCLLCCLTPHSSVFQDVARPADGVWRTECLSPSHRESLQGRWRAYNPTARVRGLQTYRQTSAVDSCCGAPSTGHTTEMWHYCQCQLYVGIRISDTLVVSAFPFANG